MDESTIQSYLLKLEECKQAILNPAELRDRFSSMQALSSERNSGTKTQRNGLSADEIDAANRATLLFLEKSHELEELISEDAELTKKCKQEKEDAVATNSALLEKISELNGNSKRRSSVLKR